MIFSDRISYSEKCLSLKSIEGTTQLDRLLLGYVFPFQFLFGIIGNSINLWIFASDTMRNRANDLLAAVSFCDLVFLILMIPHCLFQWDSVGRTIAFRYYYFYYKSELSAVANWISGSAIWLIFFITAERYLVVKCPLRPRIYWWNRRRLFLLCAIFICTFLITSYHHFEFDCQIVYFCNATQMKSFCYSAGSDEEYRNWDGKQNTTRDVSMLRRYYVRWSTVCNGLLMVLGPIIAVVILTFLLLKSLDKEEEYFSQPSESCCHRLSNAHIRQKRKITITVIAIASFFALTQGPSAVMSVWELFFNYPEQRVLIYTIMSITNELVIIGKTINFVLFCFSSAHFRRKCFAVIFKKFPALGRTSFAQRITSRRTSEYVTNRRGSHFSVDNDFDEFTVSGATASARAGSLRMQRIESKRLLGNKLPVLTEMPNECSSGEINDRVFKMKNYSLEPILKKFFYNYGKWVNRHRWACFIMPLILMPILGSGFIWINDLLLDDPAYTFTPIDARWKRELKAFTDIWPMNENKFIAGKSFEMKRFVNILIKSKDNGDVLRPQILDEIELLNQFIMNNISVKTNDAQYTLTYQDLCLNYDWKCGGNEHILMFKEMAQVGRVINLQYPKGGNADTPAYLGTALGDVVLNETDHTVITAHITQLFYFMKQESDKFMKYSSDFSYQVEDFLLHKFESDLIKVSFMHYQSLQDGLNENANSFAPNFVISFTTLFLFSIFCALVFRRGKNGKVIVDMVKSKPLVAVCGLFNTLLALVCAYGFLLLVGVRYNVLNTIIPFLIIAIGIDDMFIMNACWDQSSSSLSVEERMAEMMAHSAVAVSITNITDILSFTIGIYSSLPGISLFCIYAATSVVFCYAFVLTFFSGFTAIMGHAEKEGRHCLFGYKVIPSDEKSIKGSKVHELTLDNVRSIYIGDDVFPRTPMEVEKQVPPNEVSPGKIFSKSSQQSNILVKSHNNNNADDDEGEDGTAAIRRFFSDTYSPIILNDKMRWVILVCFALYLGGSYIGCSQFREGLEPKNLVTNSHYIAKYFEDMRLFWEQGPQLHVLVNEKVNFTDPKQREILVNLVEKFEHTEYTLPRRGTVFFFLEYLNYLNQLNAEPENTDKIWNIKLLKWLKYTGASTQWEQDIKYNANRTKIDSFRFEIAMKNMVTPNQHKLATSLLRDIADECKFKVEVYYEAFPFADQYLIILPSTLQNVGISLICMIIISFLLIPSVPSALIIVIMIISISVGVFGYMTFWGVNLDAVSMISLIMSIGFAVDLSAHIVYAFVASPGTDSKERVKAALAHLGWPIFQGASSTIAGISILYTVDAYIILTFFKTVWLTMFLGLIHGLVFIPVILSFIPISFFRIQSNDHEEHKVEPQEFNLKVHSTA
uniref:G_PROTEIN_RECEP_F1_2 domain-containing protein n=1 Tax=Rhabditophanes sp. KR3021 TaxID=114890 RepID=A0AC35U7U8_9BILA